MLFLLTNTRILIFYTNEFLLTTLIENNNHRNNKRLLTSDNKIMPSYFSHWQQMTTYFLTDNKLLSHYHEHWVPPGQSISPPRSSRHIRPLCHQLRPEVDVEPKIIRVIIHVPQVSNTESYTNSRGGKYSAIREHARGQARRTLTA